MRQKPAVMWLYTVLSSLPLNLSDDYYSSVMCLYLLPFCPSASSFTLLYHIPPSNCTFVKFQVKLCQVCQVIRLIENEIIEHLQKYVRKVFQFQKYFKIREADLTKILTWKVIKNRLCENTVLCHGCIVV